MAQNWEIIDGKLSIPDLELEKLDIREGEIKLTDEFKGVKGEFMPDMTEEDFQRWQQQQSGWAKFYDKVKSATNVNQK